MAAPPSKTLKDLNGRWAMNKTLSGAVEPALALQGVGWVVRKAVSASSVTLEIKEYQGPPSPPSESKEHATHIHIDQIVTGGLKGTTERRCIDGTYREHSDWLFGHVKGRTTWLNPADIDDPYLAKDWLEGESEASGPNGETHIKSYVESLEAGWTATQIWGFQTIDGERKYARNIVVAKGDERVEMKLIYDFLP